MKEEEQTARDFIASPVFRQIINWTALIVAAVLFIVPRVSPWEGLNGTINDFNVFRRFSEWLIAKTEDLFESYGYYVVFFGVLAENSMFLGLFVPGAVILILGGLSAENGSMNLWYVLALGFAATIIGDTISYTIGRMGWARVLERGSLGKAIERVRVPVESNSVWIILGYHFAGYSRVIGPVAAGIFQIPYRRWAPLDYAGGALWVLAFTFAGYALGLAGVEFGDTKRVVQLLEIGIFAIFVIAIVAAFVRFNKQHEEDESDAADASTPATVVIPLDSE